MAFNWQIFKTRTLTAAVFVVVMLVGLFWNKWSFLVLFSVIHFGCWWEYLKLTEKIFHSSISRFNKILLMDLGYVFFWIIAFKDHETPYHIITVGSLSITIQRLLILIVLIGLAVFLFSNKKTSFRAKWISLVGLVYISLSLGLMIYIRSGFKKLTFNLWIETGYLISLLIIISLWINDTMAYILGSLIGKTPLSKISPKKTWEGTVSGIVLSMLVIGIFIPKLIFILIAGIASIAGTFGDLLESKLKRMAGVKDSGHIMPGHGGFLDRFDSMLLAIPAVWLYVYFFMR